MGKEIPNKNDLIKYIDYKLNEIDKSIGKSFWQKFGIGICAFFVAFGILGAAKIEEAGYKIYSFILLTVSILPFVILEIYSKFNPSEKWDIKGIDNLQDSFSNYQSLFNELLFELHKDTAKIISIRSACVISESEIKSKDKNILNLAKTSGIFGVASIVWKHFFSDKDNIILKKDSFGNDDIYAQISKYITQMHIKSAMAFAITDVFIFISAILFIVYLLQRQRFSRRERAIEFANQLALAATSQISMHSTIHISFGRRRPFRLRP